MSHDDWIDLGRILAPFLAVCAAGGALVAWVAGEGMLSWIVAMVVLGAVTFGMGALMGR